MSNWENLFTVEGDPYTGTFGIRGSVILPDDVDVIDATEHQIHAVREFYQIDFPHLTYGQAHILLCYREYARHCVDAIFKKHSAYLKSAFSRYVASYITHSPEIGKFAVKWNARNFDSGTGSPRVEGSPFFLDVDGMCRRIFDDALSKGFDFEGL